MKTSLLHSNAQVFRRVPLWQHPTTIHRLHNPTSRIKHGRSKEKPLSLFDELFPEDKDQRQKKSQKADIQIPRLPLSDIDHLDSYGRRGEQSKRHANKLAEGAAQSAVKQWNPAVLVLQRASKSLIDADFRRVSPKGRHIEEWTGPGDILKVIPARDPNTFQQINHYYLLFPNPSYARTYQNYVKKLHNMAQAHTPTSIESPLPPPPGMIFEGEDIHTLLQDYALCPPSQRISIKTVFAPFSGPLKRLVDHRGYPQLVEDTNKSGRSILFWVEGHTPTTNAIRNVIDQDGRDRGLPWATDDGLKFIEKLDLSTAPPEDLEHSDQAERRVQSYATARWIVTFVDEHEARRFVRSWHKRPFPLPNGLARGEATSLVNAEYLW
ncbi:MAG: hypothetical protein Q9183_001014 [Haloplaca sp. 2 TL-2023]